MQRQSESIAALAASLAKAQIELENPEKSLVGSVEAKDPNGPERLFRYASLASGLEIVRKTLGQHDIATVQTTAVDQASGIVNLTTVLAHASGEWIASDWPVCPVSETATPHRMGAALTYARRYALFTLVGIAGEDDLDAPDLIAPNTQRSDGQAGSHHRQGRGTLDSHPQTERPNSAHRHNGKRVASAASDPILDPPASAQLRDQLVADIANLGNGDEAALWARRRLGEKNRLTTGDAERVEESFRSRMTALADPPTLDTTPLTETQTEASARPHKSAPSQKTRMQPPIDKTMLALPEPRRIRAREHLKHVATQSCLACGRRPCDPHHLRFAQGRALGRKVSDEFTVPLCRGHHREVHSHGDEAAWWRKLAIDPVAAARSLWLETHPRLAAVAMQAPAKKVSHQRKRRSGGSAKHANGASRKGLRLRNEANLSR